MSDLLRHKIIPIWKIEVKDGKSQMAEDEFSRYQKWLLSHQGQYEFIIKKKFKKRGLKMNAYYWGVVVPLIASEIGEDENVTHALLKTKFLSKEMVIAGKGGWDKVTIAGRTSKLDTHQFSIYLEKVIVWASSWLGLVIPDPDQDHNAYPILIETD